MPETQFVEERLIAAVLVPGDVADVVVEMRAVWEASGFPLFQVIGTALPTGENKKSCFYRSPAFANTEWFRHTQGWIRDEEFQRILPKRGL